MNVIGLACLAVTAFLVVLLAVAAVTILRAAKGDVSDHLRFPAHSTDARTALCCFCGAPSQDLAEFRGDKSVCQNCGARLLRVHMRKRGDAPIGAGLEYVFLVGFDRVPGQTDVAALSSSDEEIWGAHLSTVSLSGLPPRDHAEAALMAVRIAREDGPRKTGHEIDWGNATYELFRGMLVVKLWKGPERPRLVT